MCLSRDAHRVLWLALFLAVACAAGCAGRETKTADSNGELAFTVNDEGWNEVWVMAADGTKRRRLTDTEPAGNDAFGAGSPAWSPDGMHIAFSAQVGTLDEDQRLSEIYVMRADGTDVRRLTTNDVGDASPTWSPDGERIAFTRMSEPGTPSARSGIVIVDADGKNEAQITEVSLPTFDSSPAWSPDGSQIAFTRVSFTSDPSFSETGIYVISPAGGEPERLSDDGGDPDWSPNGRQLTFTSYRDAFGQTCFHECSASGEIYVLEVESGEVERLTKTEANEGSPAWSPDGERIAFHSDRSNREAHENEIYVMTASGEDVRRITHNDVWDLSPAWRP